MDTHLVTRHARTALVSVALLAGSAGCAPGAGDFRGDWEATAATTTTVNGLSNTGSTTLSFHIEDGTAGEDVRILAAQSTGGFCTLRARRNGTTASLLTDMGAPSCAVAFTGGTATLTYTALTLTLGADLQSMAVAANGTIVFSNSSGSATLNGTFMSTATAMRQAATADAH